MKAINFVRVERFTESEFVCCESRYFMWIYLWWFSCDWNDRVRTSFEYEMMSKCIFAEAIRFWKKMYCLTQTTCVCWHVHVVIEPNTSGHCFDGDAKLTVWFHLFQLWLAGCLRLRKDDIAVVHCGSEEAPGGFNHRSGHQCQCWRCSPWATHRLHASGTVLAFEALNVLIETIRWQDLALVDELTIKETIFYFGRIYGMNDDRIRHRFKVLRDLLELPSGERTVVKLSGGQKRRVSFACALVHGKWRPEGSSATTSHPIDSLPFTEPELVILDEPTVGLDPLLREKYLPFSYFYFVFVDVSLPFPTACQWSWIACNLFPSFHTNPHTNCRPSLNRIWMVSFFRIWHFLVETTRTSKLAVIITTHYIDEARQANSVSCCRLCWLSTVASTIQLKDFNTPERLNDRNEPSKSPILWCVCVWHR